MLRLYRVHKQSTIIFFLLSANEFRSSFIRDQLTHSKMAQSSITKDALAIWKAGVAAVDSRAAVARSVRLENDLLHVAGQTFSRHDIDRVIVVGAGKASGWMAAGFEDAISASEPDFLDRNVIGHVNVPDDQEITLRSIKVVGCRPAGENLPGPRVLAGTQKILELVQGATDRDLVIFMVAGGGSALLEQPVSPVNLEDFRAVTMMLSSAGANINELNAVRRAISQVKAGGLAVNCNAGNLVALIVSDVIGDPLEIIASGPTVVESDPAHVLDPANVLAKFDPTGTATPPSVREVIDRTRTDSPATASCKIHNQILCNNQTAVAAAKQKAIELGYEIVRSETTSDDNLADSVGCALADELLSLRSESGKRCVISGGEPTVKLGDNPGKGGRNQHLVLAALQRLLKLGGGATEGDDSTFCLLSGGTDGEDGNVPVAGAWMDSSLDVGHLTGDIAAALGSFDSHTLLDKLGCLIRVPPTRTNVCDLRVVLTDGQNPNLSKVL